MVIRIAFVTCGLLLVPALAMLVTGEVAWTLFDFAVAGAAIFGTLLAYDLVARRGRGTLYRAALALSLGSALLLVWINAAVGLIGSESDDFNALYGGVLLVGLGGAALARLQPQGMARAMVAMALAHGLIGVAALVVKGGGEAVEIAGVTGLFVVLFFGAAWLFLQAGRVRHVGTS